MISSTVPNYHEFHHSGDFNKYFKKRPFDQNAFDIGQTADNIYKKIKTTPSFVTKSTKTSFVASSRSFNMGTEYSLPSGLSGFINSRHYGNNVEPNLPSDTPRIIDLSTGDSLESIIPSVEISKKSKHPIELSENQDVLSSILGTMEENKEDLIDESPLHSLKRIRTSKEHMCNFIEEEEEIDPRIYSSIDITEEINTLTSNKASSVESLEKPENSQSLSLYVHEKNLSNIRFTVSYQKAIAKYMRSQIQHLNNDKEGGSEGKELILYRPISDFVDSSVKIFGIPEETMDLEGQNGAFSCINDSCYVEEEDQMDID